MFVIRMFLHITTDEEGEYEEAHIICMCMTVCACACVCACV